MISQRLNEGSQQNLLMELLEFNYTIEYKRGQENRVADALSRKDHSVSAILVATPAWVADIENCYTNDTNCTEIIQQLSINDQAVPNYSVHQGILRFKGRIYSGNNDELNNRISDSLHSFAIGGHSGIRATYHRVKRIFHWANLKKSVEQFVSECAICQRAKSEHCMYPGMLAPLPIPSVAWTFISMDFIEGLPKSGNKNVVLVVVDRWTKYAYFLALTHPFTSQTMAHLFIDNIFKLHGPPIVIVTDRDRIFTSKL
jgi:hypothetical protein